MNNDNKSDKTDKANQEKLRLAWMEALLQALVPQDQDCLLYTSPSPRDATLSRMPSSA